MEVLVTVYDGAFNYNEDVTDSININNEEWVKPISINANEINEFKDTHFIYDWYNSFLESYNKPYWVDIAKKLYIDVINIK